jgi:hypothetical protein
VSFSLRVEISGKRKEKKNPRLLLMFQRHGNTQTQRETAKVQVEWRTPQVEGSGSVCYYKMWMIYYLMRVRNVDDTRNINDGKRDR